GTPTTVAALKLGMDYASYDPQKINGTRVSLQDLSAQKRRLLAADENERKRLVGVGREDLIETGIEIFEALMRAFGVEEAVVIDDGLREGAALVGCRQKAG
ncbi:MAG: phosphatase, partial [Epsilonproteobacteria bacterium]|nr:phosphatase [Campylobacterota bacterium]